MDKLCTECKETKPLTAFYFDKKTSRPRSYCAKCSNKRTEKWRKANLERANAQSKAYAKKHPRRVKDYDLKRNYGLEYGEFDRILIAQNRACAICKETNPKGRNGFNVDHCHATNKVRGILCSNCNLGIGNLQHDPDILRAALEYLLKGSQ